VGREAKELESVLGLLGVIEGIEQDLREMRSEDWDSCWKW
jgi:hypothetical protein